MKEATIYEDKIIHGISRAICKDHVVVALKNERKRVGAFIFDNKFRETYRHDPEGLLAHLEPLDLKLPEHVVEESSMHESDE